MPIRLLQMFGFDLDGSLKNLEYRADAWKQRALSDIKAEAADIGTRLALFAAVGLLGMAALLGLAVAMIYALAPVTGSAGAWAIAAGSLALIAIVLAVFALVGRETKMQQRPAVASPPVETRRPVNRDETSAARRSARDDTSANMLRMPLALLLSSFLNWPPATGTRLDVPLAQMGRRAGQNSSDVIDEATDVMRHGTRAAVFGVLGSALVIGWLVGRSRTYGALNLPH